MLILFPTRFDTRFSGLRRSSWYGANNFYFYVVVHVVKVVERRSD